MKNADKICRQPPSPKITTNSHINFRKILISFFSCLSLRLLITVKTRWKNWKKKLKKRWWTNVVGISFSGAISLTPHRTTVGVYVKMSDNVTHSASQRQHSRAVANRWMRATAAAMAASDTRVCGIVALLLLLLHTNYLRFDIAFYSISTEKWQRVNL